MEIIIAICIITIAVLLLWIKLKNKRAAISVIIGFAAGVLSFFVSIVLLFSTQRSILWLLLAAAYVSKEKLKGKREES